MSFAPYQASSNHVGLLQQRMTSNSHACKTYVWYKNSLGHEIKISTRIQIFIGTLQSIRKLLSKLKLEMTLFSQRKISLQISFIYSFNQAHSFIPQILIVFPLCAKAPSQPLPHTHQAKISLSVPAGWSLSSCCKETVFKVTSVAPSHL